MPADKPQDVYSEIAAIVDRRRGEDADNGMEIAKVLTNQNKHPSKTFDLDLRGFYQEEGCQADRDDHRVWGHKLWSYSADQETAQGH